MFFAPHCDPHDSGPPLGLRYHVRSVGNHPTHRSKSWEELAKRRAWSHRPSHQARRKSKAGDNSLRAGVGPALFFAHSGLFAVLRSTIPLPLGAQSFAIVFRGDDRDLTAPGQAPAPSRRALPDFQKYLQIAMAKVQQIDETWPVPWALREAICVVLLWPWRP